MTRRHFLLLLVLLFAPLFRLWGSTHGLHGNDERLSVETLGHGVRFLCDLLLALQ